MATRSSIAVKIADKVATIYCHWDGYIEGVGAELIHSYNSQYKAEALIALGDLSSLGPTIENCDAYGRDRGESGVGARIYESYQDALRSNNQEYNYFWDGEKWLVDGTDLEERLK